MREAVWCVTPATSDISPVGEDQAGAAGEENAHNQAHDRSDSTNDAATLAGPYSSGEYFLR